MHLNNILRLTLFLAALASTKGVLAQSTQTATTHCQPNERIQFSCRIGAKVVSLCAGGEIGKTTSLTYRYGLIGKIENEFVARPDNKNRFYATVMPANPRAAIKQVWFNRGEIRYLLTECVGGNCPQDGGLAVLHGYKVLMNGHCEIEMERDLGGFSHELADFNLSSSPWNIQSATNLLVVVDADDHFEKIFPPGPGFW